MICTSPRRPAGLSGDVFSCKLCTMCAHGGAVTAAAFTPSFDKLATGSAESGLLIWAVDTRRVLYTLEGHFDWVLSLTFSPTDKWLVSTSRDRTARVWDARSWKALETLWGHKGAVTAALFVGAADNLLTVTDQTLRLWDSKTWRCFSSFETCHTSFVTCATLTANSRWFATGSDDASLTIWPVGFWSNPRRRCAGEGNMVQCLCAESSTGVLLSGGSNGRLLVWRQESW
mmetsp:Transcript_43295/g.114071  ORF Transcript_43295/g.114071 Transcript_43295/m.114071 type:complete len:230 (-) Transcript_43295:1244-1933(-)